MKVRAAASASRGPNPIGTSMATIVCTAVVAAAGSGAVEAAVRTNIDPPTFVPWSRVGNIWLGEPRARVEQDYDRRGLHFHSVAPGSDQGYYRVHDSRVFVTFHGGN